MSTLPVYPWRCAPAGLATYRQLRARGLRPGGHEPVGQIERRRRRGRPPLTGLLYRVDLALPVRPMTPGRWHAHHAMMRARRTCPACGVVRDYCIPTSIGTCVPCADGPPSGLEEL